jgi:hypothetical protein
MRSARILPGVLVFLFVVSATTAEAAERYYVVTFTWEGTPQGPRRSHTFATYVKLDDNGGQEAMEQFTISWLPATLNIKLVKRPEPGVNLGVRETFDFCRSGGGVILGLGPYEIRKELYDAARAQLARLEAGQVAYTAVALKMNWRPGAVNCYYAVSDAAPREMLYMGTAYGHQTGIPMLEHYGPWLMNPAETHDHLIDRLGLREHNVTFRRIQDIAPNSPLLRQAVAAPPVVR